MEEEFNRDELSQQLLKDFHEEMELEKLDEDTPAAGIHIKVLVALVVAGILGFTSYAWYTDKFAISKKDAEAPVIMADKSPVRYKPKDPGGMRIPNRDKVVYNAISGDEELPKVIRLSPSNEAPIDRESIKKGEVNVAQLLNEIEANMPKEEASSKKKTEEKKREVVIIHPNEEREPEKLIVKQELASKSLSVLDGDFTRIQEENIKIVPVPRAKLESMISANEDKSKFKIQLGSYRTRAEVDNSWNILKNKYPEILGEWKLYMEKADLGDKGVFYRLQAGGFSGESKARRICQQLTEKKQGCFVVKN